MIEKYVEGVPIIKTPNLPVTFFNKETGIMEVVHMFRDEKGLYVSEEVGNSLDKNYLNELPENTKLNTELIVLRARYNELDEDRHYVKSLLDAEFEKRKKLEKELMKYQETIKSAIQNERTDLGGSVLKQLADNLGVEY